MNECNKKILSLTVDTAIAGYLQYKNTNLTELKINKNELYIFYKLIFTCKYLVGFDRTSNQT